jgi:hypothetical protein
MWPVISDQDQNLISSHESHLPCIEVAKIASKDALSHFDIVSGTNRKQIGQSQIGFVSGRKSVAQLLRSGTHHIQGDIGCEHGSKLAQTGLPGRLCIASLPGQSPGMNRRNQLMSTRSVDQFRQFC